MKKTGNKVYKFLLHLNSSQTFVLLFSEISLGIILSISSFLLFTKIARNVLNDNYFNIDVVISEFVYSLRTPLLTQVMEFISFLGQDMVLVPFSLIVFFLVVRKDRHEGNLFLFAVITGFLINFAIKFFVARPRPLLSPIFIELFYSFPSGHAMNSVVVYGVFAFFVFRFTRNKILSSVTAAVCMILATLIGISRVYLGVHYPTDVVAGLIGGLWWIVTVLLVEKTVIFFHLFRKSRRQ